MGFSELILVNPRYPEDVLGAEAIAFSSGAQDVLRAAKVVSTVDEALAGCNFAAAVSARLREFSPPVVTPRELAVKLAGEESLNAALLFGNERFGLPNEVVQKCNTLINIPANPVYSSLNLSQAVQVLAYECRMAGLAVEAAAGDLVSAADAPEVGFRGTAASITEIEGMFDHLEQAFVQVGFLNPDNPKKLMPRLKRMFARAELETEEVNILRGLARQLMDPKPGKKQ